MLGLCLQIVEKGVAFCEEMGVFQNIFFAESIEENWYDDMHNHMSM